MGILSEVKLSNTFYEVKMFYDKDSPWVKPERPWSKWYGKNYRIKWYNRPEGEVVSIPRTVEYPEIPIHVFGREAAENFPNNVAIYYVPEERKYTYRELMYWSDRIAAGLSDLGVGKGDAVGVYMANCPEFVFSLYGITQTGAAVIPINPLLKAPDIVHIAKDSGILKAVICTSEIYPEVEKARDEVGIDEVIVVGEAKQGTISYKEFVEKYPPKPPDIEIKPKEDLCALMYTGGTTGLPKGVMLTHYNIVVNVLQSYLANTGNRTAEVLGKGVIAAVLPMCHVFGFTMVQGYIFAKSMMIMYRGFDPELVMKHIEQYKCTTFIGIPLMYHVMINHPSFGKYDLSSLSLSVSGADSLPAHLSEKWKEKVGERVGQGYGLSEASPVTHSQPVWLPKISDSIGIPILDTDAKVVDPDTGDELPPGQVGELVVKGPQVMKGYWKQPEKTKEVLSEDGWLRTGDLARMDENGYFYIVGRTKDMIKYKGYKVMPEDVERELYKHPAVLECAVIGVPDPQVGETIKAFIVLRPEYRGKVSEEDIIKWAKENMAGYKWPRKVEFVTQIPRTPVGKLFRRKLRELEAQKAG
ncbi:MAG: AMP-binding protein [Candidatus Jordarchaeales archaeon]